MAPVQQVAARYSPRWGDGCASSTCAEKPAGTAGVKLLGTQAPGKNIIILLNFHLNR